MQYILGLLVAIAAVNGSPVPQGVTQDIAPKGGMPAGCKANHKGMFGIAVVTGTAMAGATATEAPDGQPAAASQISDGQPQAGTAVNQISDGQIQAMTQIADGQIQAPVPTCAASQIGDGQIQYDCMMPTAVSQISDGQVQAKPTKPAVSQISDGQVQAQPTKPAVSQISDGQVQASPTAAPVTQISDAQPQAPATAVGTQPDSQPTAAAGSGTTSSGMTACMSDSTLEMTLKDGVLHDNQGRTGYIAANYQFQFDAPAQTGAIYTAGFSLCEDGMLTLGKQKTWYRCRSGDFYNLYSKNWAPQCEAVTIMAVDLVQC